MIQTIPEQSPFLTADQRKNRWAVPYHYEALNCRIENIIVRHPEHIRGKRILDLGCHFGTFAYAALQHGAAHVHGIDSEGALIEQARQFFEQANIPQEQYTFEQADVLEFLHTTTQTYDTIFCLGIFYYINDPIQFLRLMHRTARIVVLDTFTAYYGAVVSKDGVAIASTLPEPAYELPLVLYPYTQAKKKDYTLTRAFSRTKKQKALSVLTLPTLKAFEYFFEVTGFQAEKLDWRPYVHHDYTWQDFIQIGVKKQSHWADIYHTDIRATFILATQVP